MPDNNSDSLIKQMQNLTQLNDTNNTNNTNDTNDTNYSLYNVFGNYKNAVGVVQANNVPVYNLTVDYNGNYKLVN
jgi:hypothetical protein